MKRQNTYIAVFLAIISFIVLLRTAWIGDDTYITLRTVDNWVHGYGLTWNVGERVQAYTHPLWMFLLTAVYLFVHDGYFTAMFLSLAVSLAVFILFFNFHMDDGYSLLLGGVVLVFSKAFMEYSTSGLENPLTHLFLLLFAIILFRSDFTQGLRKLFFLALIAGLSMFNRMDTVLFFLPALLYLFLYQQRTSRGFWSIVAGFTPFILWELFSLFYYGFLFPNTAYAKLNSGISHGALIVQGFVYFFDSLARDPITLAVIGAGILFAFLGKDIKARLLALGVGLYLLYIMYIGGDFMTGRFFSAPLILSVVVLLYCIKELEKYQKITVAALVLFVAFLSPSFYLFGNVQKENSLVSPSSGITDEQQFYYNATGLFMLNHTLNLPQHNWVTLGRQAREQGPAVITKEAVGMFGYFAGPQVYVVDKLALGDPLLARIHAQKDWRVGHYQRDIVDGYVETLQTGENKFTDPNLAAYYDKLKIIVSGNLWSFERLGVIWKMNTGQYDYLIAAYKN